MARLKTTLASHLISFASFFFSPQFVLAQSLKWCHYCLALLFQTFHEHQGLPKIMAYVLSASLQEIHLIECTHFADFFFIGFWWPHLNNSVFRRSHWTFRRFLSCIAFFSKHSMSTRRPKLLHNVLYIASSPDS